MIKDIKRINLLQSQKLCCLSFFLSSSFYVYPEIFTLAVLKKLKIAEKIIKHHPRVGGRSELSGIKNLIFNSLGMIKYMIDLKNDIKKSQSN